jgi:hypothetical protein
MRQWAMLLGLLVAAAGCAGSANKDGNSADKPVTVNFEQAEVGQAMPGFTAAVTNGPAGQWIVREDSTSPAGAKVLVQENSDPTNGRFPLCIYDGLTAKDVTVTVAFKPISGKVDQAAGIVVRYQDKDNYYVARANGLEGNVRLYKVEAGKRKQFAGFNGINGLGTDQWCALTLKVRGNTFEVALENDRLFDATDDTFQNAGKVGLWTKADSVIEFDDLRINVIEK